MIPEVLERIIKRPRKLAPLPSEQKSLSGILAEIGEARKNGSPVLADYQIDWKRVAIGVTSEHLKKLDPSLTLPLPLS